MGVSLMTVASSYQSVLMVDDSLETPKQAAAYYKHHLEQRDTLRKFILDKYFRHLDGKDYLELRALRRTFWYTDLKDSVTTAYMQARSHVLPKIDAGVDSVCQQESVMLESQRKQCKEAFADFICLSIRQSLKGLSQGFLLSDEAGMQSSYQGICAATLPLKDIKAIIVKYVNWAVTNINDHRRNYVNQLAGYAAATGNFRVSGFKYMIRRNAVACPIEALKNLNGVKNSIDWLHLDIPQTALFSSDLGNKLLAGGVVFTSNDAAKSKDMKLLVPIINQIATATAYNIQQSVYTSVDQVFDQLLVKTQSTQAAFRQLVHNKY